MSTNFVSQSTLPGPVHLALIMDGNGRWANRRGLPRSEGHRAGARSLRRIIEAAPEAGVGTLTLYAFSSDNWKRPRVEVEALMGLFETYLAKETRDCRRNGVRLNVIGRRDRLEPSLRAAIERAERVTAGGAALLLRVAIDYSARHTLTEAARRWQSAPRGTPFAHAVDMACRSVPGLPPVDLLIRTGGEYRLSDFLLWELAYAELVFSPVLWPDFEVSHLEQAIAEFTGRQRRFGGLPRDPACRETVRPFLEAPARPATPRFQGEAS